jgi:hypothetical protein
MDQEHKKLEIELDKIPVGEFVEFFGKLVGYIFDTTSLESVTYDGQVYCNRSNERYDRTKEVPQKVRDTCDEDVRCDFHFGDDASDCICTHERVQADNWEDITYNLSHDNSVFDPSADDVDDEDDVPPATRDRIAEWLSEHKSATLDDVIFKTRFGIKLCNKSGENDDHRGLDHTKLQLDFHSTFDLPYSASGFSLRELAVICYRMKSHKFDYCYEQYGGASVSFERCVSFGERRNMVIQLYFSHGS